MTIAKKKTPKKAPMTPTPTPTPEQDFEKEWMCCFDFIVKRQGQKEWRNAARLFLYLLNIAWKKRAYSFHYEGLSFPLPGHVWRKGIDSGVMFNDPSQWCRMTANQAAAKYAGLNKNTVTAARRFLESEQLMTIQEVPRQVRPGWTVMETHLEIKCSTCHE
jgi:hypothetical protein